MTKRKQDRFDKVAERILVDIFKAAGGVWETEEVTILRPKIASALRRVNKAAEKRGYARGIVQEAKNHFARESYRSVFGIRGGE